MARSPFQLVCQECLAAHGVLESDTLPEACPTCGARDPWVGPIASAGRFDREEVEQLPNSPLYLAAIGQPRGPDG